MTTPLLRNCSFLPPSRVTCGGGRSCARFSLSVVTADQSLTRRTEGCADGADCDACSSRGALRDEASGASSFTRSRGRRGADLFCSSQQRGKEHARRFATALCWRSSALDTASCYLFRLRFRRAVDPTPSSPRACPPLRIPLPALSLLGLTASKEATTRCCAAARGSAQGSSEAKRKGVSDRSSPSRAFRVPNTP